MTEAEAQAIMDTFQQPSSLELALIGFQSIGVVSPDGALTGDPIECAEMEAKVRALEFGDGPAAAALKQNQAQLVTIFQRCTILDAPESSTDVTRMACQARFVLGTIGDSTELCAPYLD